MKDLKISIDFLKEIGACEPAVGWFQKNVGIGEYLVLDLMKDKSLNPPCEYISWLIVECPEFRISKMLEYYKSLRPDYDDVSWLMSECPEFRTSEMLEYYKSLRPHPLDMDRLIRKCPELQNL